MKRAHQYLNSKGKSPRDLKDFKLQLYDLWFKLYRRTKGSRALDSSGFEHVFVGETRGGTEVLGFHNWIQFYLQEKAGNVDYQGYILGKKVATHIQVFNRMWCYVELYDIVIIAARIGSKYSPTYTTVQVEQRGWLVGCGESMYWASLFYATHCS